MKKFLSLLLCILMITSIANFSSIVNAVTSIQLPTISTDETISEEATEAETETEAETATEAESEAESEAETEPATEEVADELIDKKITGFYNGYTVEVSGMLPRVATLSLTSVNNDSAQELVAEMDENGKAVFACDIKIIGADGKEWQPGGHFVNVKVTGIDETDKEVQFLHFSEDIETVLEEADPADSVQTIVDVTKGENGELTFPTFGFSTFVGFTVDFHYNGKKFSINGMSDVLLSEIFSQLGIDKNVADVADVTFTDTSLVTVEKEGDDWRLTSHEAFFTEEGLKVTFKDGEVIGIKVTDASEWTGQTSGTYQVTSTKSFTNTIALDGTLNLFNPSGQPVTIKNSKTFFTFNSSSDSLKINTSDLIENASASNRIILQASSSNDMMVVDKAGTLDINYVNFVGSTGHAVDVSNTVASCKFGNCTFEGITSSEVGSAIRVNSTVTSGMILNNCGFKNCISTASGGGAIGVYESGKITGKGLVLNYDDEFAQTWGSDGKALESAFYNCSVSDPTDDGTSGGAIRFANTGADSVSRFLVHIEPGVMDSKNIFEGCKAYYSGVFYVVPKRSDDIVVSTVNSITFDYGYYDKNGNVTPDDNIFTEFENVVDENGNTVQKAVVYDKDDNKKLLDKDTIIDVDIYNKTETEINNYRTGATFKGCEAQHRGGVAWFDSGNDSYRIEIPVMFDGVVAEGCIGTDGAVFNLHRARMESFTFKDCIFRKNRSENRMASDKENHYGGSVLRCAGKSSAIVLVDNCAFTENYSFWSGGALYWNAGDVDETSTGLEATSMMIKNSNFIGNSAAYSGGAIFNESIMNITRTKFSKNSSLFDGGAIRSTLYSSKGGGTKWKHKSLDTSIGRGCVFEENYTGGFGGAVSISLRYSPNVHFAWYENGLFDVNFNMFDTYQSYDDKPDGVSDGDKLPADELPVMKGNVAGICGGGFYMGLSVAELQTTPWNGGHDGYYSSNPEDPGEQTTGNSDGTSDLDKRQGLINVIGKNINIYGGIISDNEAGYDGGGIYANVDNTKINVTNGEIYGNKAGVTRTKFKYVSDSTELEFDCSNFATMRKTNTTKLSMKEYQLNDGVVGYGGGICLKGSGSELNFTGGKLGKANAEAAEGDDEAAHIYGNRADFGGAVAVNEGTVNVAAPYVLEANEKVKLADLLKVYNITNTTITNYLSSANVTSANEVFKAEKESTDWYITQNPDYEGDLTQDTITISRSSTTVKIDLSTVETYTGTIEYNYAVGGAAIYTISGSGTVNVSNGHIQHNHAEVTGSLNKNTDITLTSSITNSNRAAGTIDDIDNLRTNAGTTLKKGSGGGVYAHTGTVNLLGGNVNNNVAIGGAGGGIFIDSGGYVKMSGGNLFSNEAQSTYDANDTTTTANGNPTTGTTTFYTSSSNKQILNGVGGAVAVNNGSSGNPSEFVVEADSQSTIKMGIYRNIADFAADDVYASGTYTDLDVPEIADMYIPTKNSSTTIKQSLGWFEDFHTKDPNFSDKKSNSSVASGASERVQRYRTGTIKTRIESVDTAGLTNRTATNTANAFVNMTLGIVEAGAFKIGKTVVDASHTNSNTVYDKSWFEFTIKLGDQIEGKETAKPELIDVYKMENGVIDDNGEKIEKEKVEDYYKVVDDDISDKTFVFKIRNGYYVRFDAMGYYTVVETVDENVLDTWHRTKEGLNGDYTEEIHAITTGELTVTDANPTEVEFINQMPVIEFSVKFYDRAIVGGSPSDMNSTASTATTYIVGREVTEHTQNLSLYVANKIKDKLPENMLDRYSCYQLTDTYHLNQYGKQLKDANGNNVNEKWFQLFDRNKAELGTTKEEVLKATKGVLWLKNELKKYSVNYYNSDAEVLQMKSYQYNGKTYYTCTGKVGTIEAYYNQRVGTATTSSEADDADLNNPDAYTTHLNQWGKRGYTGTALTSAKTLSYDGENLHFSHWSNKPDGSTIVTTNLNFNHRITKGMELYAIYATSDSNGEVGVSVSDNVTDTYMENDVEYTRLNTMISAYNFQDNALNNISGDKLASVYVITEDTTTNEDGTVSNTTRITPKSVRLLREKILEILKRRTENSFSETIEGIDGVKGANFIVRTDPTYTNKNRVNLTTKFTTANLKNRRLLVFAGVNYTSGSNTKWLISDNCMEYKFNDVGTQKEANSIYKERTSVIPTYVGIVGDVVEISTTPVEMESDGEQYATETIELEAGTYKFKIVEEDEWRGSASEFANTATALSLVDEYDYCTLNATGGKYTFKYDFINNTLDVSYVPPVIKIVSSSNDLNKTMGLVNGTSTATYTTYLPDGEYKFNITEDGLAHCNTSQTIALKGTEETYDMTQTEGNCTLTSYGGKYTFTYNYAENKLTVEHVAPSLKIAGTGDLSNVTLTPVPGTTTATKEVALTAGTYTFSILEDEVMYGNATQIEDETTGTGLVLTRTDTNSCTLVATGNDTFTFTYDYVSNTLTVIDTRTKVILEYFQASSSGTATSNTTERVELSTSDETAIFTLTPTYSDGKYFRFRISIDGTWYYYASSISSTLSNRSLTQGSNYCRLSLSSSYNTYTFTVNISTKKLSVARSET